MATFAVLRGALDAWRHPDLANDSAALQPATGARVRKDSSDGFTSPSRPVLDLAHQEATQLRNAQIGAEHLLLGLLDEGNGVAAHVPMQHGVELAGLRQQLSRGFRLVIQLHRDYWASVQRPHVPSS